YLPRRKHIGRNPAGDQPFGQLVGVGADSVVPERVYQSDGSRTGHAYAARGEAKPAAAARSADSRLPAAAQLCRSAARVLALAPWRHRSAESSSKATMSAASSSGWSPTSRWAS